VLPLNIGLNHEYLAAGLFGLLVFLALLFRPRSVPSHFGTWLLMLGGAYIPGFLMAILPLWFFRGETRAGDIALAVECWLLGETGLLLLMKRYDTVRRGAFRTALGLGIACAALYFSFLSRLLATNTPIPAEQASFWTMEVIFSALSLCWVFMLVLAAGTWVLHARCLAPLHLASNKSQKAEPEASTPQFAKYARARAAFCTARLSLAVSASMISLVTVFLWAGAFSFANKSFNLLAGVNISYPPPPFYSITRLIVPSAKQARYLVSKADKNKANCGKDSDEDNSCEAGSDAPAEGPPCAALSPTDQDTLQKRPNKVEQVLVANGGFTPLPVEDLQSRIEKLNKAAGIKPRPGYGCVIRVYLLENKAGIAEHTEFHVLARALLLARRPTPKRSSPVMVGK
jgi:hypothetical protein